MAIFLHVGSTPRCIGDDRLDVRAFERLYHPFRQLHRCCFFSGVYQKSSATRLRLRRDDFAPFGGENPHCGGIDLREEFALYAAQQQTNPAALRAHGGRDFRDGFTGSKLGKNRFHRLHLLRQQLQQTQSAHDALKSGLQSIVRGLGLLKLLPKQVQAMEALLPKLGPRETVAEVTPAVGTKRRRVGLLLGCVQREFFSQVNAATARVLAAEGCEVVAPQEQPCCGALLVHAGEEAAAVELAKRTIDAFEPADVETVVTNAAGCGSNVKEYGHLLRDEPEYAERARVFAAKCKDVSEILAELEPRATRHRLKLRVAFHDSCHLQHAQGVRSQLRALLSSIPGLELAE